ncbi:hypothetical protein RND81_02G043100 [Saponaria officinalis]|uniref:No apical meristem-associated C-terminal domain-containing protein n=1 Tax=Saponaria officinalis TaxID=3572 RepID=A0AAW1MRN4_SAPOF
MSTWIIVSTNAIHGKNNQAIILWKKVWKLYDEARWGKKSGKNEADVVAAAQKLYEDSDPKGKYYTDLELLNNVLCKNVKWNLEQMNYNFNDELSSQSRSSSKRSRVDEIDISTNDDDDDDESIPETPPSVNRTDSIHIRPEGRDAAKKKRSDKSVCTESSFHPELNAHLLEMNFTRNKSTETMIQIQREKNEAKQRCAEMCNLTTLSSKPTPTNDDLDTIQFQRRKIWGDFSG